MLLSAMDKQWGMLWKLMYRNCLYAWVLVCFQVLFRRSLQGGVVRYPLESVLAFLEQNNLDKYRDTFWESGMDGDLLLEADDNVLKELGVSSSVECSRIKTKYKNFVKRWQ